MRFRLAADRQLLTALLGIFLRTVFAWQRRRGRALGIVGGQTGAITFLQRFGSAMNLNPHLHAVVPDGLFVADDAGTATAGVAVGRGQVETEGTGLRFRAFSILPCQVESARNSDFTRGCGREERLPLSQVASSGSPAPRRSARDRARPSQG